VRLSARKVLALLAAWLPAAPAHSADAVLAILSERGGAYTEVAEAVRQELPEGARLLESGIDGAAAEAATAKLAVAVGAQACAAAARAAGPPLLCTLVPRSAFERAIAGAKGRGQPASAVLLDQPPARQMALVRLLLPPGSSVALLLGPESSAAEGALAAAAARHGLRALVARTDGGDLPAALQRLLDGRGDALLAVPDPRVFNPGTVQNILRATMRGGVPVVAFSPAYVGAGALAALHSTPRQLGRQAGRLARDFLGGRALPAPQPPAEFTVSLNGEVARALGLAMPDEKTLAARLQKLEPPQ
jgi:ABC-type uncharacterized transport system substrate-binding protein